MKEEINAELKLLDLLAVISDDVKRKKLLNFLRTDKETGTTHEITTALLHLPFVMQSIYYELPRDQYRFSAAINIFLMACEQHFDLVEIKDPQLFLTDRNTKYELATFILTLYFQLCSPTYRQAEKQLEKDKDHNSQECWKYINKIFSQYSKVLVIRIDLYYKAGVETDFLRLKSDFRKLQNNARHNQSVLSHWIGYIFKIEYGVQKRLHGHVLMFFNAQRRNHYRDITIAQEIGEYWKDTITEGDGDYHNCNAKKADYYYPALGLIEYSDTNKRMNLRRIVQYLCKKHTQYIKPINKPDAKLITKGFVSAKTKKLGRPREKDYEVVDGIKYYNSGSVLEEF